MAIHFTRRYSTIVLLFILVAASFKSHNPEKFHYLDLSYTTTASQNDSSTDGVSSLFTESALVRTSTISENAMRACMLIRNDNQRLAEWVAYHYTVLPLRHLIVGSDVNSTDNPMDVLAHWNNTPLKFQVWYGDDMFRDFKYNSTNPSRHFLERQANLFYRCMMFYHAEGNLGWVALADTDEYIKLNPLDDKNDLKYFPYDQPTNNQILLLDKDHSGQLRFLGNETLWDRLLERKRLRQILALDRLPTEELQNVTFIPSVLDVLEDYSARHEIKPCFTMARIQYSAVMDNVTALASLTCRPRVNPTIASSMNVTELTTMRYLYHWNPDIFHKHRWGKVLIDLRRIPPESLLKVEQYRNAHAPLAECGRPPALADIVSFLRVNHYLHDFSVYTGRKGDPRTTNRGKANKKLAWSRSAHGRDRVTCDHMAAWVNEFFEQFGIERAKALLGQEQ